MEAVNNMSSNGREGREVVNKRINSAGGDREAVNILLCFISP